MQTITDYSQAIEEISRLRRRESRIEAGLTIVEGYTEVSRMAEAKVPVKVLYICPEIFKSPLDEFRDLPIVEIPLRVFEKMAFGEKLKGILAVCRPYPYRLDEIKLSKASLIIVLEKVEKPGSLGTVIRTSDGAGADCVIMCNGKADIYSHHVVRSSMGTVFHLPTVESAPEDIIDFLRRHNVKICVATARGRKVYAQCDLKGPTAFIFGNEYEGVSPFWLDNADETLRIPMMGEGDHLNVAACASILTYEALRQRT